jgi:KipI family sensor histidine kinase inhibitor
MQYKLYRAGLSGVLLVLADQITPGLPQQLRQLREYLLEQLQDLRLQMTPSYTSLLLEYDLLQIDHQSLLARLKTLLDDWLPQPSTLQDAPLIQLPVFYDPLVGPDLQRVASACNLAIEEVIQLHSSLDYEVCALGFAPGFAYLSLTPPALSMPRLSQPRKRVPAGSVALADRQTAVYPQATPGGWNLLGRTPLQLFDAQRSQPSLLLPGQRVQFVPINQAEFLRLGGSLEAVQPL